MLNGVNPQGPFFLTQVCMLWKAVAESDLNLCMSIHFYFPESQTDRDDDILYPTSTSRNNVSNPCPTVKIVIHQYASEVLRARCASDICF